MKKTYYAKGLLEWQAAIRHNGLTLRLLFSGGTMGSNGVVPARYETDNPVIQKIIESSQYYKEKRIFSGN